MTSRGRTHNRRSKSDAAKSAIQENLLGDVRDGDKRAIAQLFNLLEDKRPEEAARAAALLDELYRGSIEKSHVVGITGPPGVGKSCLVSRLIGALRGRGRTVGVIAVDPSSRASRGALLGDRIRFEYDVADAGIFVRSMANRGAAGGVSDRTYPGIVALRAAFDVVLVETVGIGQSEADVAALVDTTLLVVQPASGDALQFLKAGIMEEPHLIVVNKSDLGAPARRALNDVRSALGHIGGDRERWTPRPLLCSAATGEGIEGLVDEMARHSESLRGRLAAIRRSQAASWIAQTLRHLYGERGTARLREARTIEDQLRSGESGGPFKLQSAMCCRLESGL